MKSAVETLNPTRVKLTVEVPFEELKPSLDAAYKEIGAQITVPGFRPGKVPTRIIEQRVGRPAILQEAVNHALPEMYGKALEDNEVRPLGQPEVDVTKIPVEDGEPLEFTAEVDVRPKLDLPAFDSLEVTVDPLDDEAVEAAAGEQMESLRQRFGTLIGVERAAEDGDFVSVDLTAVIEGEEIDSVKGVSYEIGSGNMLPGMDEALVGMSAEETKTFQAPLAGGDHAGKDADVTITVQSVKIRELPELDDDFAQLASEFDTLDELRADLRTQAERAKKFDQGIQARDKLMELLLEKVEVPLPESLVEAEIHSHLEGEGRLEDDEHRAEVDGDTRSAMRTQLLLDSIADQEDVEVSQQELIDYLVMTSQQYGMDPSQFAQAIDQQGQIGAIVAEVARRKALAVVLEHAKVTDSNGETVDLNALVVEAEGEEFEEFEEDELDVEVEVDVEEVILDEETGLEGGSPDEIVVEGQVVEADVVDAEVVDGDVVGATEGDDTIADATGETGGPVGEVPQGETEGQA